MGFHHEVRLSGSGGQGLILAGIVLAEAAGIFDGHNVVQTQSYGPEARGGASRSEVIISDEGIDYPKVTEPDIVLVMSQEASDKYARTVKPGGAFIADSGFVEQFPSGTVAPDVEVYFLPITEIAQRETGRRVTANMAALGVMAGVTGVASTGALEKAIANRVPVGTAEINLRAFRAGFKAVV